MIFLLALAFLLQIQERVLYPIKIRLIKQKEEAEKNGLRLMALFSELDPEPAIRINLKSEIIHINDAARELYSDIDLIGKKICDAVGIEGFDANDIIKNNKFLIINIEKNAKYFFATVKGHSFLDIAQVYFSDITDRKKMEDQLLDSKAKLLEYSIHLQYAIEEERQRIARELHDGVGQNLSLLRINLQNVLNQFPEEDQDRVVLDAFNSLDNSIRELKDISHALKPRILEEMGLTPALASLCHKISNQSGIKGDIQFIGDKRRIETKKETFIYRIAQEALNNIVKHSKARKFSVQMIFSNEKLKLIISDDGIGIDFSKNGKIISGGGMGLDNMRERVRTLNGELRIDAPSGGGTAIFIDIPINNEV